MYVYENNFSYSAEEMIKDYLEFRKERENRLNASKNISSSSIENNQTDSYELFHLKPYFMNNDSGYVKAYDRQTDKDEDWKNPPIVSEDLVDELFMDDINMSDKDSIYIKQVSSDMVKKIYPVIEEIVDKMEYEESPIYDEYIPKLFIDEVTERAYENAVSTLNELSDLTMEDNNATNALNSYVWSKSAITKELIRQLLFIEIFGRRRSYKKRSRDDYRYY